MNRHPRITVGGVVVKQTRLFLIQRAKEPGQGLWSVPGGKVKWGETLRQAVSREVWEETHLRCRVKDMVFQWEYIDTATENAQFHYVILDFLCDTDDEGFHPASDALQGDWYSLKQARSLGLAPGMPQLLQHLENKGIIEDDE